VILFAPRFLRGNPGLPPTVSQPFHGLVMNFVRIRPKRVWSWLAYLCIVTAISIVGLEFLLRWEGFGEPPLYQHDPVVGYTLKPSQALVRFHGARVLINSLGMRSAEISKVKGPGRIRVLVLGDSMPYGGSYIDQDDLFCSVAQRELNRQGERYEILNAGVNAYGPVNIWKAVHKRGLFNSDLVIVFLPWADLRREFTSYYVVPFWSVSPGWALAEFIRHGAWYVFGKLSRRWKGGAPLDQVVELNIQAMVNIKNYCDKHATPVYFFWSPQLSELSTTASGSLEAEKERFRSRVSPDVVVDLTQIFRDLPEVASAYVDDCHYSVRGHRVVGRFLTQFVRSHAH
jgi:hypothetical protein